MNFDDIVKAVSDCCPPFNDHACRDFVEETINNSPEFPAVIFREGFKLVPGDLELMGYDVVSPEERVKFELRAATGKSNRPKIPLTVSHLRLVQYRIRFGNHYVYTRLYTPYLMDGMLYIKDKRSMIRKVILERTVSRLNEKEKDGISVSPIRVNIWFNRRQSHRVESYTSGNLYSHFIVTARLFHGKVKNKICDATIIHFMLAKFGMNETLKRFGVSPKDILFVEDVAQDTDKFEYFKTGPSNAFLTSGSDLFLKVNKKLLADDRCKKLVVNILYVLNFFTSQNIHNVYSTDEWSEHLSIWKIILGTILFEEPAEARAYSNALTNLKSIDSFIDPLTRDRFCRFGIPIEDIYDLIVYIFNNIDSLMVNMQVQDLYNSRLDVANGILVESFAKRINHPIYMLAKKSNITIQDVESTFRFNPMLFRMTSSGKKDDSEHYIAPPDIINDNFLLAGGLNKIKLGGKAEQRLHPSMVVAESIGTFVGKQIGKTGLINPYIPTDENNAIIKPDYAKELDELIAYLPK
jgi:hypothetical protein